MKIFSQNITKYLTFAVANSILYRYILKVFGLRSSVFGVPVLPANSKLLSFTPKLIARKAKLLSFDVKLVAHNAKLIAHKTKNMAHNVKLLIFISKLIAHKSKIVNKIPAKIKPSRKQGAGLACSTSNINDKPFRKGFNYDSSFSQKICQIFGKRVGGVVCRIVGCGLYSERRKKGRPA